MLEQRARFNAKGMNLFLLANVPIQPKTGEDITALARLSQRPTDSVSFLPFTSHSFVRSASASGASLHSLTAPSRRFALGSSQ